MEILVHTDSIKEAGFELRRELPAAELDATLRAEPSTGFSTSKAAELTGKLDRVNDSDIVFTGRFRVEAQAECRRCLDPVPVTIPVDFVLGLVKRDDARPAVRLAGEDDGEGEVGSSFDPSETDEIGYAGKQVDLWPAVREQLLLATPLDALCKDDCRGLCQVCGTNRNLHTCACDPRVPDPRWEALKNVKLRG